MSENLAIKNNDDSEQFTFVQMLEATIRQGTNEMVLRNPKDNRSIKLKAKIEAETEIKPEFENLVKSLEKSDSSLLVYPPKNCSSDISANYRNGRKSASVYSRRTTGTSKRELVSRAGSNFGKRCHTNC